MLKQLFHEVNLKTMAIIIISGIFQMETHLEDTFQKEMVKHKR
jgi:hypothetical protein